MRVMLWKAHRSTRDNPSLLYHSNIAAWEYTVKAATSRAIVTQCPFSITTPATDPKIARISAYSGYCPRDIRIEPFACVCVWSNGVCNSVSTCYLNVQIHRKNNVLCDWCVIARCVSY